MDFITASMDPEVFPKPELIDLERPESSYLQFGYGPHECLGKQLTLMAMTSILKVVAGNLEGLTVEGDWKLKGKTLPGGIREFLTEDWARWNAFPTSKCAADLVGEGDWG